MKETEKVPFDSMPPLIRGLFLTKEQSEKLKDPFKDVVSVVRCKDCKYYGDSEEASECPCKASGDPYIDWNPEPDWYCANGVRKDDSN